MKITVVGSGLAGLLAANILRRHHVNVYEKQDHLPNNHHAVLRFRGPDVGNVLGIQFRKVNMLKTYVPHYDNIVADSLSYSKKTTGVYRSDRSIVSGTVIEERYVAPPDLVKLMSENVDIKYGRDFLFTDKHPFPIISTIPMPVLMSKLKYKSEESFKTTCGMVATTEIKDCDAYVSVLFPGPGNISRATITGNKIIIEFPGVKSIIVQEAMKILFHLGVSTDDIGNFQVQEQKYFKITEINEAERLKFMKWATVNYRIFSLGRYACWRPKLLLDDLIKDVRLIESWMLGGQK